MAGAGRGASAGLLAFMRVRDELSGVGEPGRSGAGGIRQGVRRRHGLERESGDAFLTSSSCSPLWPSGILYRKVPAV